MSNRFHIGCIGFHPCIPRMLNFVPGGASSTMYHIVLDNATLKIDGDLASVTGSIQGELESLKELKASDNENVPFLFARTSESGYQFTGQIVKVAHDETDDVTVCVKMRSVSNA